MTREQVAALVSAGDVGQLFNLFEALKDQRDRAEALSGAYLAELTKAAKGGKSAAPKIAPESATVSPEVYSRAEEARRKLTEAMRAVKLPEAAP